MSLRVLLLLLLCWMGGATAEAATPTAPVILVLGDSLSAGYGLDAGRGWVHLLEQKLKSQGLPQTVVNASVSGDTTAGGLARLPALLERHRPRVVVVELGGNDGLRGLPVKALRDNLGQIVDRASRAGAKVMLCEMRIPDNYGQAYADAFNLSFTEVAQTRQVPLAPFLMAGFATDAGAFQDDGIHPNAASQSKMLDTIWPTLGPMLRR